jgi:hypothetical protein
MRDSEESTVLSSWKDIANYLGKGVRTVQRWERHFGLPVRRPNGATQKGAVMISRREVDAWLATRFSVRSTERNGDKNAQPVLSARTTLHEGIRTAHKLRTANVALTEQITASIRLLTEQCTVLITRSSSKP